MANTSNLTEAAEQLGLKLSVGRTAAGDVVFDFEGNGPAQFESFDMAAEWLDGYRRGIERERARAAQVRSQTDARC